MTKLLVTALIFTLAPAMLDPAAAQDAAQPSAQAPAQTYVQANPRGSSEMPVVAPNPETAASPVAPALPDDPNYHAGPYVGALTPPPPEAFNKHYPICHGSVQDNCRNRGGN